MLSRTPPPSTSARATWLPAGNLSETTGTSHPRRLARPRYAPQSRGLNVLTCLIGPGKTFALPLHLGRQMSVMHDRQKVPQATTSGGMRASGASANEVGTYGESDGVQGLPMIPRSHNPLILWRRARDSNPQGACAPVDFKSTALPVEASPPGPERSGPTIHRGGWPGGRQRISCVRGGLRLEWNPESRRSLGIRRASSWGSGS